MKPRLALIGLTILLGIQPSLADSARVQWIGNKHYYQRFDFPPNGRITWAEAKTACEARSAHLATLTSFDENAFVFNSLLFPGVNNTGLYFFFGASDVANESKFRWVTGEPFNFTNWASGEPHSGDPGDADNVEDYLVVHGTDGKWADAFSNSADKGYVCEWSANQVIDTARVPGLNADAVLFVNYKTGEHTVQIKHRKTKKTLSTLTFAKSFTPPLGLAVIRDISGNRKSEIAVLYTKASVPTVIVKDALNNKKVVKTLNFFTFQSQQYRAVALSAEADLNRNKADELTVLVVKKKNGKPAITETRDSKTKRVLNKSSF